MQTMKIEELSTLAKVGRSRRPKRRPEDPPQALITARIRGNSRRKAMAWRWYLSSFRSPKKPGCVLGSVQWMDGMPEEKIRVSGRLVWDDGKKDGISVVRMRIEDLKGRMTNE